MKLSNSVAMYDSTQFKSFGNNILCLLENFCGHGKFLWKVFRGKFLWEIFGTKVLIPRVFELGGNVHSNELAD
jgi:hypothetical protein